MTVNFPTNAVAQNVKPFENFGFDPTKPASISAASAVETDKSPVDKVDIQKTPEQKEEKKGVIQGAKDIVRAIKKFGITISEYTKGTFKGIIDGLFVGGGIFLVGSIVKFAKNHKKEVKEGIKKASKLPVKSLAVIGGLVTLLGSYWKTSLIANEKKADVDHKYTTTPIIGK